MSKLYTTKTAALKAVKIDSNIVDAKKIFVHPGVGDRTERVNILDLLANNNSGEIRITAPHALGDFYFSITPYMPEGVLPLNGSEVSRTTYSDLYDYVLTIHNELAEGGKKFIVSEGEWQNISIENNGYVPYYSYGVTDGMFRLPRMSGYLKASGEVDEAGNYVAEGLPNIEGAASFAVGSGTGTNDNPTRILTDGSSNISYKTLGTTFSIEGELYGKSEHVTPETNTLFVGVWALVAFTQVGTANLEEIKKIITEAQDILSDNSPLLSYKIANKGLETSSWKHSSSEWLDGRIYSAAFNFLLEKISESARGFIEIRAEELISPVEFPYDFLVDTHENKFRLPIYPRCDRFIVKEYKNDVQWYRIYNDGYVEQGGEINGTAAANIVINLLIPFIDTTYTVVKSLGINGAYTETISGHTVSTWNYTTTTFTARTGTSSGLNKWRWFAFGFGEVIPQEEQETEVYYKVSNGSSNHVINIEEKLTEFEETAYTRLNEVVEEISKDYVVHVDKQVGELYFSFDNYCPDGVIPLDGRLVSRATYADLWEWVQEKGLVKEDALITTNDENTVSIFNEDGTVKYCSWYGSGDGSLTFRVPKINGYIKASGDNTSVGQYIAEGLPNITGTADVTQGSSRSYNPTGAFYETTEGNGGNWDTGAARRLHLDASRSNSIYGNSEHVTPETNTLFVGVWGITATRAAVFDLSTIEEALKSSESYFMNNVPLMSSRWDRDGLGNLGWVKADGSWIDGRHYTGAYAKCVEHLINGHEDFIDGQVSVISEENYDKFVVDRIGKRFRLPISNGQRTWEDVQGLNNPDWVLYWKLAHEFYVPAQAEVQEKLDLIDNLVAKTDINLPTLSSRWDSDFAENIGWVKSEGHWLNGNVYRDAYDLMVSRIGVNDKFIEATEGTELTDENADKFLIDTTAVKFRLPLINGERVLVAKYNEWHGWVWYNLYSDGWLEQGAAVGITTTNWATTSFVFPRKFKDLYYSIHAHGNWSDAESSSCTFTARSVEGATITCANNKVSIKPTQYEARGFSNVPAISEYNCGNYLFFKLADEVPSTVINTEQVVADLKQECDDFKNALEEKFNSGAFVTETWRSEDGNNWYRKWSDGWIEQGGVGVTGTNVTFPTSFSNIPTLTLSEYQTGGNNSQAIGYHSINNTGFMPYRYSGGSLSINWYACGY